MPDNLEKEIQAIVAEIMEVEPEEIQLDNTLEAVQEIESVAMLEVLVTLERQYEINITEDDLKSVTQMGHVVDLVRQKIAQKKAG
ncbi:acyl carrier protein [bacterium]|nr:acyl carrier protein [bacterium]